MDVLVPKLLTDALDHVINEAVFEKDAAIAFSGGLDSGIVAAIAGKYQNVMLYTVGTQGAYDVQASEELASSMGLRWNHILLKEEELELELREMMAITGTINPITLSFEIPLFYILKYSEEKIILSGQGADELFAGYAKYKDLMENDLKDQMKKDMMELMNVTIKHERMVADHFGKTIIYPYLNEKVLEIVEKIEIKELAPRDVRKSVLREVAIIINEPEIASKPKKAAQYGSGTMNVLRSISKKKGMTVNGMISTISEGL